MFGITCGFRNLRREFKRYLLLLAELAAVAVFACICGNVMLSYRHFVQWNQDLPAAELTEVSVAGTDMSGRLAITPEDYLYFKQAYGQQEDVQFVYCIEYMESFYNGNEIKTVPVLYVSEEYVTYMLQAENAMQGGMMSGELRNFLSSDNVMRMGAYEPAELLEAASLDMEALDMKAQFYTRYTSYGMDKDKAIPYQDCVLLPLSSYQERKGSMATSFLYLTAGRELLYQEYGDILEYLYCREENQNPATKRAYYSYSFANQMEGLKQANELFLGQYQMILRYMGIGIGIISINVCGILLLTVSRRKEEYALQIVVGAGRGQLYAGMLAEIGTVVLLGLMAGAAIGASVTGKGLLSGRFPVQNHPVAFLLIVLFGILFLFLSSLPFLISLHRLEPVELLQ